jgi:glucosylglycerate hydrolase
MTARLNLDEMAVAAADVLRRNDLGGWTKAAPRLYPHQWSWDSAFISIGLAHVDTERAARELLSLFGAQWATGLVPHIVFNPDVAPGSYFPDAERWDCARLSPHVPLGAQTSGLIQPPVHALASWRIREMAVRRSETDGRSADALLHEIYPKLLAWHRYLMTARDPEESGLVTIYHPWESGTDNSPRWDRALAGIAIGDLPPYTRVDIQHVADASQRPSNAEYDRYLWLVELLKRARYDDGAVYRSSYPFQVKDVLLSGILVAANEALQQIAEVVGVPDGERFAIAEWITRGRRGLQGAWDAELGLCLDYDLRIAESIPVRTIAGFAPIVAGGLTPRQRSAMLTTLESAEFLADPRLRWRVPPSTSPGDPAFRARSYWRGPTWPVLTWLCWWALKRDGEDALADSLREASLDQIATVGFAEYVEPFTGDPLGSLDQSWTAAVAIDWLSA